MSDEQNEQDFSIYTPLAHDKLDTWGLIPNTRVWTASNSFEPVQTLEAGDYVFGVTFQVEDVIVPDGNDGSELAKAWRPKLTARKVLGVRAVKARAWQMTFGDEKAQYDSRRLVGGAMTTINSFPFDADRRDHKKMADLYTAVDNPRNGSETREAKRLDKEWTQEEGEPVYRETEFSGMRRGDYATIIPYEAYGGQLGHIKTSSRDYNRFAFSQVREVDVLHHRKPLVQIMVQPDTEEKFGASEENPRCNLIAQTPFRNEQEQVEIVQSPGADATMDTIDRSGTSKEEAMDEWDQYVDTLTGDSGIDTGTAPREEGKKDLQGSFYKTKDDEEIAKELKEKYGLEGGFLNGGIVIHPPLPAQYS